MVWPEQNRLTMLDSGPVALAATLTPKQAANRKWSESAAPAVCPQTHTHQESPTRTHLQHREQETMAECCGQ